MMNISCHLLCLERKCACSLISTPLASAEPFFLRLNLRDLANTADSCSVFRR